MFIPCSDEEDDGGPGQHVGQGEHLALHLRHHPVAHSSRGEVLHLVATEGARPDPVRLAPLHRDAPLPHLHQLRLARGGREGEEVWSRWIFFANHIHHGEVGRGRGLSGGGSDLAGVEAGVIGRQVPDVQVVAAIEYESLCGRELQGNTLLQPGHGLGLLPSGGLAVEHRLTTYPQCLVDRA